MPSKHSPQDIQFASDNSYDVRVSNCSNCGLAIESWIIDDEDMGYHWTSWGIKATKGNTSTLIKECL